MGDTVAGAADESSCLELQGSEMELGMVPDF